MSKVSGNKSSLCVFYIMVTIVLALGCWFLINETKSFKDYKVVGCYTQSTDYMCVLQSTEEGKLLKQPVNIESYNDYKLKVGKSVEIPTTPKLLKLLIAMIGAVWLIFTILCMNAFFDME